MIEKEIKKNNIKNVFLLGHKKNPYKYISKSELFISSSLWEDPGHALIEAAYLNKFIITSECHAGPKEMFKNKFNCLSYAPERVDILTRQIKVFFKELSSQEKNKIKFNAKKLSQNFTELKFYKSIKQFIV